MDDVDEITKEPIDHRTALRYDTVNGSRYAYNRDTSPLNSAELLGMQSNTRKRFENYQKNMATKSVPKEIIAPRLRNSWEQYAKTTPLAMRTGKWKKENGVWHKTGKEWISNND